MDIAMQPIASPLDVQQLFSPCDAEQLGFETTESLAEVELAIGQERALDAIRFGVDIRQRGYNIFVMGPAGAGRHTVVNQTVARQAEDQPVPADWCYLNDFAQPSKPKALRLPAGKGHGFRDDVNKLIDDLRSAIPAAFEGEEYRSRVEEIEGGAKEREGLALHELREEARQSHIMLVETPTGFAFAPVDKNDDVLTPDEFKQLPEGEQERVRAAVEHLQQALQKLLRQFQVWRREAKEKVRSLNREIVGYAASHLIEVAKAHYQAEPEVIAHFEAMEKDIIDHVEDFLPRSESNIVLLGQGSQENPFQRYRVNLLVDHGGGKTAPVVYETLPTHANLIGRMEYHAHMGALFTNFTLIKPGALHKANGGYLILDALPLLTQPFAWDCLKRALRAGEVAIESLERRLGLVSTATLEPQPIPLDVKVILIGDRRLYYLLTYLDSEFADLFKVAADFEETIDRDADAYPYYARVIGTLARRDGLRPLDKHAVARLVEHGARLAEDAEKLTTHQRSLADLLKEADHWAGKADCRVIGREHVQHAIDQQIQRADRIRTHLYEAIRRGTLFIDLEGAAVGQINGLSVLSLGGFSFGQPSRITATTRLGSGKVVDIERETELGGAIHSKGVLILSSFLAARYARDRAFSVSASLVFEQSYGQVEGDSASLAELCAILSSLAELPIDQSLAMTGSVNQLGRVQPIGGVNQKVEGFFDVCRACGLNGKQGVIIPQANVKHLMLRHDVVEACRNGQFRVHAVETVDQALALLLGLPAGERGEDGAYPEASVNGKVEARLQSFAAIMRELAHPAKKENGDGDKD
jgi:lon-related putative ATP-dependent protease